MTKDNKQQQYNVPRTKRCSRIRASATRRSKEYYNALINTALYDPKLHWKESHDLRHQPRLAVVHSETNTTKIRQEAAKDLLLHGQSLTRRTVKSNHCECLIHDLICLKDCK